MTFEVLDTPVTELGEGPFWDEDLGRLGFVDILGGRLHLRAASGAIATIEVRPDLSAVTPVEGIADRWLAACADGVGVLHADGRLELFARTGEPDGLRLNDGKCDPAGRFWVGSMARDLQPGLGSLYRVDLDGGLQRMDDGITLSNGLGWSPDTRTFYLVDSIPGLLYAWDFDLDTGEISGKRLLNGSLGQGAGGVADGMAIDDDGNLWIAYCGGGVLRRFGPDGRMIDEHVTPMSQPTCPAFGDEDGGTLYLTSAATGLDAAALAREPSAGRVVSARLGATGRPASPARIVPALS